MAQWMKHLENCGDGDNYNNDENMVPMIMDIVAHMTEKNEKEWDLGRFPFNKNFTCSNIHVFV